MICEIKIRPVGCYIFSLFFPLWGKLFQFQIDKCRNVFYAVNVQCDFHPLFKFGLSDNHLPVRAFLAVTSKTFIKYLYICTQKILRGITPLKTSCRVLCIPLQCSLITGQSQRTWWWFAFWLLQFLRHTRGFPSLCNFCMV